MNQFNKWKRFALALMLVATAGLSMARCDLLGLGEDEEDNTPLLALLALAATQCQSLSGTIGSTTIAPGSCALLNGTVFVSSGSTLTVGAGATVFGNTGSSLFILPGAKLEAIGTASSPVVFTSAQAVGRRASGDWGGLVLIGNASNNRAQALTEGTTPQNYGGPGSNNDADSSGTLRYVRIEYGGFPVTEGNELNGLSLYTVGSGTTLEFIQVHMAKDDGIEWFGGTVDGKFLLVTGASDDDFDIDEGYRGRLQFLIGHKYGDGSAGLGSVDPRGLEWNGRKNNSTALGGANASFGAPIAANVTLIGSGGVFASGVTTQNEAVRLRQGLAGNLGHVLLWNWAGPATPGRVRCTDNDDGSTDNTSIAVVGMLGQNATGNQNDTAACGAAADINLGATGTPTAVQPIQGALDLTTATSSNYQPIGGLAATANPLKNTGAFNVAFFTDNSTFGGMISGSDWTTGWTTYVNK